MPLFPRNQTPLKQFVALIESSGLLPKDVVQRAHDAAITVQTDSDLETSDEISTLADSLVKCGLLTIWQCEKLRQGRWKGFFLGPFKLLGHVATTETDSIYLAEEIYLNRRVHLHVLPCNKHVQSLSDWHVFEGVQFKVVEVG
ncbi:MAG TPA: hypothetical protein VGN12_28260 [Pirellulales bacterium]|jgi:serine/threonine-protein kinase